MESVAAERLNKIGIRDQNLHNPGLLGNYVYRKSSIRSGPCVILNPKFPRLILEVFQKL